MLYLLRTISPSRSCSPPSSSLPPFLFSHSSYFTLIVLSGLALWLIGLCVCVCLITGMLCFSCVIYVLPVGYLSVCVPKVQGRWCIFNYMCTYVCGCAYLSVCGLIYLASFSLSLFETSTVQFSEWENSDCILSGLYGLLHFLVCVLVFQCASPCLVELHENTIFQIKILTWIVRPSSWAVVYLISKALNNWLFFKWKSEWLLQSISKCSQTNY